ncbi:MAG TPA: nucleoside-diphosphate sugar epimerase/dehydratase [bacterium]|nr:nucleoside-diphosphate sugar epimerase/dehydratase [bacterium]HOL47249.1 nucleoside-diphosphate sugar epimerase/dehydratase [bacterium]HPQ19285.1 nucleoside-diphosphate sugar epimerase/dehydratase [bacterium]
MKKTERVLIVGAGVAGKMVYHEIKKHKDLNYKFVGFVDDFKKGKFILGKTEDIENIVKKFNINLIIIAIPSAKGDVIRRILSYAQHTSAEIKIVPGIFEIISGDVKFEQIRKVEPEDLLGREVVNLDLSHISNYFQNKTILITGCAGSIGSELTKKIGQLKIKNIIGIDQNESELFYVTEWFKENNFINFKPIIATILDVEKLYYIFKKYNPDIVVHAAAYKHVPLMEENPSEAVKNNILGTLNLLNVSVKYKIKKFVLISSDKAVNPVNVMGCSKRICELLLLNFAKKNKSIIFNSIRFGNVLSSRGSVVPTFINQIKKGGPITVTHPDIIRYFMTINEAVQLIIQCIWLGKKNEIFVLDMGEPIKIVELAKNLINLFAPEIKKNIEIVFTGLRPGEKLFEEYLTDSDKVKATKYNKIFIAKQNSEIPENFEQNIKRLLNAAKKEEISNIYKIMQEIDKTFKPSILLK